MKITFPSLCLACLCLFNACKNENKATESTVAATQSETTNDQTMIVKQHEDVKPDQDITQSIQEKVKQLSKQEVIDSLFELAFQEPKAEIVEYDTAALNQFTQFANLTGGQLNLVVHSTEISKVVNKVIDEQTIEGTDILFLIDKTASMEDDIDDIRKGFSQIVRNLKEKKNVRLSVGFYGDLNYMGDDWFSYKSFEGDLDQAIDFVDHVQLITNTDDPESVYDGFFEVKKHHFWQSEKKRIIVLIGDAPSQEKPLSHYSMKDVIDACNKDQIRMNFYPILLQPVEQQLVEKINPEPLVQIDQLYPNPTRGEVNLTLKQVDDYTIQVFDVQGKMMANDRINQGWHYSKDFSYLPMGAYLLRVMNGAKQAQTEKFVIYK